MYHQHISPTQLLYLALYITTQNARSDFHHHVDAGL